MTGFCGRCGVRRAPHASLGGSGLNRELTRGDQCGMASAGTKSVAAPTAIRQLYSICTDMRCLQALPACLALASPLTPSSGPMAHLLEQPRSRGGQSLHNFRHACALSGASRTATARQLVILFLHLRRLELEAGSKQKEIHQGFSAAQTASPIAGTSPADEARPPEISDMVVTILPNEVWLRVFYHLRREPTVGTGDIIWWDRRQGDLVSVMRTSKVSVVQNAKCQSLKTL